MANPYDNINPRDVDPAKGPFEPTNRQPHGAMHIDKTYQDRIPKEQRPRYQEWLKRSQNA